MTKVVIIGTGALGREVLQLLRDLNRAEQNFQPVGFVDRDPAAAVAAQRLGLPFLGGDDGDWGQDAEYVIAVGAPALRRRIAEGLSQRGAKAATLVHPSAVVADSAVLGAGVVVSAFSFVGVDSSLGGHAYVNTHVCVGHDVAVGAYTMLSPFAAVNGGGQLGEGVFMGSHAVVTPGRRVGHDAKVAAGSVVYAHVPPGRTAMGNPAQLSPLSR